MLMRMAGSRDLGIGSNLVPYSFLLVAAVIDYYTCVSCQPSYLLLGLIIQCSASMSMASILVCPKSHSDDADIVMQVCHQAYIDPTFLPSFLPSSLPYSHTVPCFQMQYLHVTVPACHPVVTVLYRNHPTTGKQRPTGAVICGFLPF